MLFKTTVYRTTGLNPHFIHKIHLTDDHGEIVANANVWTNLPSDDYPAGHTKIMAFNAQTPAQAKQLHAALVKSLTELHFPLRHVINHSISRYKLKQNSAHWQGFNETPENAQRKTLYTQLDAYRERFQRKTYQNTLKELDDLPAFTTPKIFRETLEQYAFEIPDDKYFPEGRRKTRKQPHENDPLFLAVPNFTDSVTHEVNVADLVKYMHPELAHLSRMEAYEHPNYKKIATKISGWRKRGLLEKRKNMEYPISEEGRAQHTPLVHWYLQNMFKQYTGHHTGLTYMDAVEIGLKVIDMIYPKFDPTKAKFSSYFGKSFQGRLQLAVKRKAKERRLYFSLDQAEDEKRNLHELIAAPEVETEREELAAHRIMELVLQVAQKRKIPPKELLLWGLVHLKGRTLQRVGERFNVTRARIQQKTSEIHQTIKRDLKPKEE